MTLSDFITTYAGKSGVGDTPENTGQCVGLVEVYTDSLGLKHTWGNAKDLLANADPSQFDVIQNTPTNVPLTGDVVVWGDTWGNGNGHTGIFISGDATSFQAFEQNDPQGSTPHTNSYTYNGVIGWLHPKPQGTFVDSQTFTTLVDKATKYDGFNAAGYETVNDVIKKVQDLTEQVAKLSQEVSDAKAQASAAHDQMAKMANEDSTAIQAGMDAQGKLDALSTNLQGLYNAVGGPQTNDTQQQVQFILSKFYDLQKSHEEVVANVQPTLDQLFEAAVSKRLQAQTPKVKSVLKWFIS